MIPTGSSAQQDGRQVGAAFLTAWEKGTLATAANLTDLGNFQVTMTYDPSLRTRHGSAGAAKEEATGRRVDRGDREHGR